MFRHILTVAKYSDSNKKKIAGDDSTIYNKNNDANTNNFIALSKDLENKK